MLQQVSVLPSLVAEHPPTARMDHVLFIRSSTDGHLGCFHFVDNAAVNTRGQALVGTNVFVLSHTWAWNCWGSWSPAA